MTAAHDPHAEWAREDRIADLARVRAWEHRFQDFDSCKEDTRRLLDEIRKEAR